ncbi:hypothetical protein [Salinigranum sp. GCM10025319]|uniref:hypothetical protein n=1 Tax=Salinigranum sp. GCM10025319 TaxID=3252687 RepID=UPI0036146BB7
MYPPVTLEARPRPPTRRPRSWRGLLVTTVALGAVPFALWTAANPVVGAVVLGGVGCVVAAVVRFARRRASEPDDRDGSSAFGATALSGVDSRPGTPPAGARR